MNPGMLAETWRSMRSVACMLALVLIGAGVGLSWISVALVTALTDALGPIGAPLLIGALFLAPALFACARDRLPRAGRSRDEAALLSAQSEAMGALTRAAQSLAQSAPLAAVGLAAMTGFLASRFPAILGLLAETVTQVLAARSNAARA